MKLGASPFSLLVSASLAAAACGGARAPDAAQAREAKATPPSAQTAAPQAPAAPPSDPAVLALAEEARKCFVSLQTVDPACFRFQVWKDEVELFKDDRSMPTLLNMLEGEDTQLNILAIQKLFRYCEQHEDKAAVQRIVARAKKESAPQVARWIGHCIAATDMERLGMGADLRAVIKLSPSPVRAAWAEGINFSDGASNPRRRRASALNFEVLRMVLEDTEKNVQLLALEALGAWEPGEESCKLLRGNLARTDHFRGPAQRAAILSGCPDTLAEAVDSMSRHLAASSSDVNEFGGAFCSDAEWACRVESSTPEIKHKAFEVVKQIVNMPDANTQTRVEAIGALSTCDPKASRPILNALARDKDINIRETAKIQLGYLNRGP